MITVAVDCMGGDVGLAATLPACAQFLRQQQQRQLAVQLLLVGPQAELEQAWMPYSDVQALARIVPATEVVAMDDPVEVALRKKRDSSMRVALQQVKEGAAQAALSAGNTGALMAIARYVLKTMDGIDRPAIATQIPNCKGGATTVLDLGANVNCNADHLLQFAVMGSALVSSLEGRENPSVGLLNIGQEIIKGGEILLRAGELLRAAAAHGDLNFYGNVEGDDVFRGTVDIVVCDGFVGNVLLKTAEGVASMFANTLKESFSRNAWSKASGLIAKPVLQHMRHRLDYRRYNGAALLGLRGLVFKSHGSADAVAFEMALTRAYEAARHGLQARVAKRIEAAEDVLLAASSVATAELAQVASGSAAMAPPA